MRNAHDQNGFQFNCIFMFKMCSLALQAVCCFSGLLLCRVILIHCNILNCLVAMWIVADDKMCPSIMISTIPLHCSKVIFYGLQKRLKKSASFKYVLVIFKITLHNLSIFLFQNLMCNIFVFKTLHVWNMTTRNLFTLNVFWILTNIMHNF